MKVRVFVERSREEHVLEVLSLEDVLRELRINPDTVLLAVNGRLVTKKAELHDGDRVELLSVISGG